MTSQAPSFHRLVASVELVARHADYPGKRETVALCLADVEDLSRSGRISPDQEQWLRAILLGGGSGPKPPGLEPDRPAAE